MRDAGADVLDIQVAPIGVDGAGEIEARPDEPRGLIDITSQPA
jgi:hypothetical protein